MVINSQDLVTAFAGCKEPMEATVLFPKAFEQDLLLPGHLVESGQPGLVDPVNEILGDVERLDQISLSDLARASKKAWA